ncbi:hypothetical protein B0J13DRAFT_528751 [Dactylonectria estremocensis]|uniref:Uncharacterized protein n=1 Tax=Dactylonectria estremocensis TaxID=1079267 RepID=A0A9P9EC07_9HYPO|nr:hypothetical protein B0J13DRAFT_528751 [Dactylonectria estremocensis]
MPIFSDNTPPFIIVAMLGFLRPVASLFKTLLLISLPVTLVPFLNGLIEGVFVGNYLIKTGYDSVRLLEQDLEAKAFADLFDVTDAALPPFHVVRLQDPTNWWEKLGLERLDFDKEAFPPYGNPDPDNLASLHGLHRRITDPEAEPWHHWVYASARHWHTDGLDEWDKAFEELIQYYNVNPSVGFHYISCRQTFLCAFWRVNGPALLHFTTAIDAADTDPEYEAVHVQIIELPITGLAPGVFPSHLNQLKAVTGDPPTGIPPHSEFTQFLRRYVEICEASERAYPETYGRLAKWERALLWTMSFEDSISPKMARFVAVCLSGSTRILGYRLVYKCVDLLGYTLPTEDDDAIADSSKFSAP